MKLRYAWLLCLLPILLTTSQTAFSQAKILRASDTGAVSAGQDQRGRSSYIIRLRDDARRSGAERKITLPLEERHDMEKRQLVQELSDTHHFIPETMTSLVGFYVVTRLDEQQLRQLADDPRVIEIIENTVQEFSAVWTDSISGGSTTSWGTKAVGGGGNSTGAYSVYLLDSGVANTSDLNISSLSGFNSGPCPGEATYFHGTHVAGIIGAKKNSSGTTGVRPGAPIVSINITNCDNNKLDAKTLLDGIEAIKNDILQKGKIGVVNLSANGDFGINFAPAISELISPTRSYKGAVFVQSAGNFNEDACSHVYHPTDSYSNSSDGAIIVGGMDEFGQEALYINGNPRFYSTPTGVFTTTQNGTNFGDCVETWAPSTNITSLWGNGQIVKTGGTSMAAPHITGTVLALLEMGVANTPSELEQALHAISFLVTGSSVKLPNLSQQRFSAQPAYVTDHSTYTPVLENGTTGSTTQLLSQVITSDSSLKVNLGSLSIGHCSIRVTDGTRNYYSQSISIPFGQNTIASIQGSAFYTGNSTRRRLYIRCTNTYGVSSTVLDKEFIGAGAGIPTWLMASSTSGNSILQFSEGTTERGQIGDAQSTPGNAIYDGPNIYWTKTAPNNFVWQGHQSYDTNQQCKIRTYRVVSSQNSSCFRDRATHYYCKLYDSGTIAPNEAPILISGMPDPANDNFSPRIPGVAYRWLLTCWDSRYPAETTRSSHVFGTAE